MVSLAAQPAVQPQETTQQNLRGTQTEEVRDWQSLVNALNNANAGTIKLTGDITVANKGTNVNGIKRPNPVVNGGKMNLTGENISGGLIIDGQGHSINFGANYLSFDTDNQKRVIHGILPLRTWLLMPMGMIIHGPLLVAHLVQSIWAEMILILSF